ncbi:MAG: hypothetical protein CMK32_07380 [Porticoccaceae bacterium]|nr:hypothetical protein [Porticoccaceae bacterium]
MRQRYLTAFFPVLLLALTGCVASSSTPPNYYLLTAIAEPVDISRPIRVGVGPVTIAPFLDRSQMAMRSGGGNLALRDAHRWGEPLDDGIERVLVQNLAAITGGQLVGFPWRRVSAPKYAVRLDVLDMNVTASEEAVLELIWQLEDLEQNRLLADRHEHLFQPLPTGIAPYEAMAMAYSELLGQLAGRINGELLKVLDGDATTPANKAND